VLLLYEGVDAQAWAEHIQTELQENAQIQDVALWELGSGLERILVLCPLYTVVGMILTTDMLASLDAVSTPLMPVLESHRRVCVIKLHLEEVDEKALHKVT